METTLAPENLTMANANEVSIGNYSSAYLVDGDHDVWVQMSPKDGVYMSMTSGVMNNKPYGHMALKFEDLDIAEATARAILQMVSNLRVDTIATAVAANEPAVETVTA